MGKKLNNKSKSKKFTNSRTKSKKRYLDSRSANHKRKIDSNSWININVVLRKQGFNDEEIACMTKTHKILSLAIHNKYLQTSIVAIIGWAWGLPFNILKHIWNLTSRLIIKN